MKLHLTSAFSVLFTALAFNGVTAQAETRSFSTSKHSSTHESSSQTLHITPFGTSITESMHELDKQFSEHSSGFDRNGSWSNLREDFDHLKETASEVRQRGGFNSRSELQDYLQRQSSFEHQASRYARQSHQSGGHSAFQESLEKMRESSEDFQLQQHSALGWSTDVTFFHKVADAEHQTRSLESDKSLRGQWKEVASEVHVLHDEAMEAHRRGPGASFDYSLRNRIENLDSRLEGLSTEGMTREEKHLYDAVHEVRLDLHEDFAGFGSPSFGQGRRD